MECAVLYSKINFSTTRKRNPMVICHVRDSHPDENKVAGMASEEKLVLLSDYVQAYFTEAIASYVGVYQDHDEFSNAWRVVVAIMCEARFLCMEPAPAILKKNDCQTGKDVIERECQLMYEYFMSHRPLPPDDGKRLQTIRNWAQIYDLILEPEKKEKRAA